MSYEQVNYADYQADEEPYNNSRNRVCSGRGQDHTLVKPISQNHPAKDRLEHSDSTMAAKNGG